MLICYFYMHLLDILAAFTTRVHCTCQIIIRKIEHKNLLSVPLREISGFLIKPQIIGDSAFPNQSLIIKNILTPTQRHFKSKLCGIRCVMERAFGMIKSRWQILLKKNEQKLKSVVRTVTAAIVMHKFCLKL